MFFAQPSVPPLQPSVHFSGKTALITGANRGLGFATARTFLLLGIGKVILAVRNDAAGSAAHSALLSDPKIRAKNPSAEVKLVHVDLEDLATVCQCVSEVQSMCDGLDLLVLNAGTSHFSYGKTKDGHERIMQVNYLANVLMIVALLPLLRAATKRNHGIRSARIVWVGSRRYKDHAFTRTSCLNELLALTQAGKENPGSSSRDQGMLRFYFDNEEKWSQWERYNDSKFLVAMFVREFARRVDSTDCLVTMCCPGMMNTGILDELPLALWMIMSVVMAFHARSCEEGSWVVAKAGLDENIDLVGHGSFLKDGIVEPWTSLLQSKEGSLLAESLWEETMNVLYEGDGFLHKKDPWPPSELKRSIARMFCESTSTQYCEWGD